MRKRDRDSRKGTAPGTWQLFSAEGYVVADVYPLRRDVLAGFGCSVFGLPLFGLFHSEYEARVAAVSEFTARTQQPTPQQQHAAEEFEELFYPVHLPSADGARSTDY